VTRPAQRVLLGAGAVVVAGLVAGAVALAWRGGGGSAVDTSGLQSSAGAKSPPPPPRGALVLAEEAGTRSVALAVDGRRLTATVLSPSGGGESGLHVSFRLGSGTSLSGRSCGPGCYRALAPPGASLRRVQVLLPGGPAAFTVPTSAPPAAAIVRRATQVFRRLRSLVYVESLRSGPSRGLVTTWRMAAPNRLSYRIHGGAAAVVIGRRRWDQTRPHGQWARSSQIPPLSVPQPIWGSAPVNAHVLGTTRLGGRAVWLVSFANPAIPAWFTVWIDRGDYRTLRLRMTAAAHFMFHRYTAFDRPLRIVPPR
jgi:hypothetical protein